MRIQHNIAALNSHRQLMGNNNAVAKNLEKLSSGYRINRAGDDAAGLAISEKMRAQITGLETAQKNANDGISLVQTAEGALTEVHSMLNRMVELADQSANGTYQDEVDRENLQKEIASLKDEINRIADSTNFNGINLLDGSLAAQKLSKVGVSFSTENTAAGVTINKQEAGVGSKGEYSIDLNTVYGTGDKIDFTTVDGAGATLSDVTLTYNDSSTSALTFTGATKEEQAKSIADALKMDADLNQNFDISVNGTKVTLTSKVEGLDGAKVTSVKTTDQTLSLGEAKQTTPATEGNVADKAGWEGAFSGAGSTNTGIQPEEGDILTFHFTGANGEDLKARVEITKDMLDTDVDKTTQNIIDKLNQTKFDDDANTAADESSFKVGDLFTVKANLQADGSTAENGSIYVKANQGGQFNVGNIDLERQGTVTAGKVTGTVAGTAGDDGDAAVYDVAAPATPATDNFTAGDKFTITGNLSDGKTFSVELEAGKDFAIGAKYEDSMNNIIDALTDKDKKIEVTIGNDKKVAADLVFDKDNKENGEFTLKAGTDGALTITSNKLGSGKGVAGNITNVSLTAADSADSKTSLTNGIKQGSAVSSIDLDSSIEYGTAIKIGDKTYEIVEDSRDVSNRSNVAVQISDLKSKSTAEIAKALADTVNGGFGDNGATMTATATGSTVTFTSVAQGSDVAAIEVSTPYGTEVTTASFKFDPEAVKAGSTFTFNGNSYEFVKAGEKAGTGKTAIEVADFDKATAKSLGDAFANVAKNGVVKVADDGTVSLTSLEGKDGTIASPQINFYDGLSLQIGDTSDAFNRLSVSVKDMHAASLGIGSIDVSTQAGALDAVDKIKTAINNVSSVRGDLGAIQNRLEHTINNLGVTTENMTAAESRIRDVDMAKEMMNYTKNNILVQASQAMLAQANQQPQGVLQLLQ